VPKKRSHNVQNGNTGLKFGSSLKGSFDGLPFFARSTLSQLNAVTFQTHGFNAQSNAYLEITQRSEWQYWPQIWIITKGSSFGLPFALGHYIFIIISHSTLRNNILSLSDIWLDSLLHHANFRNQTFIKIYYIHCCGI
jgi:hypothetical protein